MNITSRFIIFGIEVKAFSTEVSAFNSNFMSIGVYRIDNQFLNPFRFFSY